MRNDEICRVDAHGPFGGRGTQAQTIGIAACDQFVTKDEACVGSDVPTAQQSSFKGMVD